MKDNENWTLEIHSQKRWLDINLSEIWQYRDLIRLFVYRDLIAAYKQTILGPLWFVLGPLLSTIIFTVIFGNIAQIPTDNTPPFLFYLSGIIIWTFFASCINKTSNTFIDNCGIFGKVYFPRIVVPISVVITNLFTFLIQFTLFIAFFLYYYHIGGFSPNFWILLLPLLLIQMAALGLGMGILISSMTTKYRDLIFLLGFGVQLWMYATPIVYPLSQIPEKWQWLFALNPMTATVEVFRYSFFGKGAIQPWMLGISTGMTIIIIITGILIFSHIEKTFMDTV